MQHMIGGGARLPMHPANVVPETKHVDFPWQWVVNPPTYGGATLQGYALHVLWEFLQYANSFLAHTQPVLIMYFLVNNAE